MPKLQKEEHESQHQKLVIKTISIKVKFACRCFLEYQINQQVLRTRQFKVDSKNTHYEYNQIIQLPKQRNSNAVKRPQELRITVKLLSSKGLSFTVGYIDLNQSTLARYSGPFDVKVSQTQDIQARCTFELIKAQLDEQYKTPNKQTADVNLLSGENINDTNSSKSKNSKLEMEFEELREDYYKLKDKFSKYQQTNIVQTIEKFPFSEPRRSENQSKRWHQGTEEQKQKADVLQLRIKELERQLAHNNDLFNKQKEILRIFEANLKQKNHQYEQLRKKNHEITLKCEQLYKSNCILEEQKIKYLMEQLKTEKEKGNIGEYMAHMFQQIYNVIENIFKKRISNITSLAQSKQLNKNEVKRQSLTTPRSPIKKLFYSTDFRKCQQQNYIAEDVSISGGELSASEIRSMNTIHENIVMKNILKDFQPKVSSLLSEQCIDNVKTYCFKIEKIVNKSVQRLFKTIMELTSYNQAYRRQLNEEKQQHENNQQSLIDYLEQLQEGLQTQLQIVKEKDLIIQHNEGIIHRMNQILTEKERRIHELEQAYDKLEDEKNQIKAELHQNNYLYAMKEEQFLKKIYKLQTGFQKPQANQTQHQPTRLNIIQRKPTVFSDNCEDQFMGQYREFQDIYQNEIIYESPKICSQQQQNQPIYPEKNQIYIYEESNEDKLRHTMLKNNRISLVNKLREQMSNAENAESIDEKDEEHQKAQKVIQQEFLKVLV